MAECLLAAGPAPVDSRHVLKNKREISTQAHHSKLGPSHMLRVNLAVLDFWPDVGSSPDHRVAARRQIGYAPEALRAPMRYFRDRARPKSLERVDTERSLPPFDRRQNPYAVLPYSRPS